MKSQHQHRGLTSYHAGCAAEASVERQYVENGYRTLARRWRGHGNEIDLILQNDDLTVFVEVKKARTHEQAAERFRAKQFRGIAASAQEFLLSGQDAGKKDARFDVALVDCVGQVHVIENANMA